MSGGSPRKSSELRNKLLQIMTHGREQLTIPRVRMIFRGKAFKRGEAKDAVNILHSKSSIRAAVIESPKKTARPSAAACSKHCMPSALRRSSNKARSETKISSVLSRPSCESPGFQRRGQKVVSYRKRCRRIVSHRSIICSIIAHHTKIFFQPTTNQILSRKS